MRAEHDTTTFTPFKITLTIESELEAAAIFAAFNNGPLLSILYPLQERENAEEVRRAINNGNGGTPDDYDVFHNELCRRITKENSESS